MAIRTTLSHVARQAQMSLSRATVREFADDHLIQEIKKADVYHSESPTDIERFQQVGITAYPLKQEEDTSQKQQSQSKDEQGDWDHNQPTGKAAEAIMLYMNGQRSHPVALVDDRRVRPYEMSEGEGAHYAPDGSEQMVYFKESGTYIVSLDNVSVKDKKNKKTRFVSMRHVNKKMQTHKIDDQQQQSSSSSSSASTQARSAPLTISDLTGGGSSGSGGSGGSGGQQQKQKYKHEGDSVNTEVRVTASRIEFRTGDKLVGHYDKGANKWELYESGGTFRIIIQGGKIIGQNGDTNKSFMVDNTHTHIKFSGNSIWVDKDGCWSTKPIETKADNCT